MESRRFWSSLTSILVPLALASFPMQAEAHSSSIVQPIYARVPGGDDVGRAAFEAAVTRYRLRPIIQLEPVAPPASRAPDELRSGRLALQRGDLATALRALDAAVDEAVRTGGSGLETAELVDLYYLRGLARGDATRASADFVRAAVFANGRTVEVSTASPAMQEAWKRAVEEVSSRQKGEIVVRAPAGSRVSVDSGPAQPVPATVSGLRFGEHLVRVDEPGRKAWTSVLPLAEDRLEVDVPEQPQLTVDDATAAAAARMQGAQFALLMQPRPELELFDLRLIDVIDDRLRDEAAVKISQLDAVDLAVMRLDELARKQQVLRMEKGGRGPIVAPSTEPRSALGPPLGVSLQDNPRAWARAHWPLVTAVSVWVGTALTLGLLVALD